jgi:hypothetical protein
VVAPPVVLDDAGVPPPVLLDDADEAPPAPLDEVVAAAVPLGSPPSMPRIALHPIATPTERTSTLGANEPRRMDHLSCEANTEGRQASAAGSIRASGR